jgi:hypothetical protein
VCVRVCVCLDTTKHSTYTCAQGRLQRLDDIDALDATTLEAAEGRSTQ